MERAARDFDGWIASNLHRQAPEVVAKLAEYRAFGGRHAIVSTIPLSGKGDETSWRGTLDTFAEAGFDEAVVLLLPGGPTPSMVRSWVA